MSEFFDYKVAAKDRWHSILAKSGINSRHLTGRNCPCPLCGGTDRFRFLNTNGDGTWICNQCTPEGASGIQLLMKFRELTFKEAVEDISRIIPNTSVTIKREDKSEEKLKRVKELWDSSKPIQKGDEVDRYLINRGISLPRFPDDLRFNENCSYWDYDQEKKFTLPAMVALVRSPTGKPTSLHRTYLTNGQKANIESPRRFLKGRFVRGSAIRLSTKYTKTIGIAEGIETSFHAMIKFNIPVWSVMDSSNMEMFLPPSGVENLYIFGDNDKKFGGQKSAYHLAHRLSVKNLNLNIKVKIPPKSGTDWAD